MCECGYVYECVCVSVEGERWIEMTTRRGRKAGAGVYPPSDGNGRHPDSGLLVGEPFETF